MSSQKTDLFRHAKKGHFFANTNGIKKRSSRSLRVESLEERQLLSVTPDFFTGASWIGMYDTSAVISTSEPDFIQATGDSLRDLLETGNGDMSEDGLGLRSSAADYNENDVAKLLDFLEQTDSSGVKNGTRINVNYDSSDPSTFGVTWHSTKSDGKVLFAINWGPAAHHNAGLVGNLDLSDCVFLDSLNCSRCNLTSLNLSGCVSLKTLDCSDNTSLGAFDVSGCTSLRTLTCDNTSIASLDLRSNTSLRNIKCWNESLTEVILASTGSRDKYSVDLARDGQFTRYIWKNPDGKIVSRGHNCHLSGKDQIFTCELYDVKSGKSQSVQVDLTSSAGLNFTASSYNTEDVEKLRTFLELTDQDGVKNGNRVSSNYDPDDPSTYAVGWKLINGTRSLYSVSWSDVYRSNMGLVGTLDLSGCEMLQQVNCGYNKLSGLDVSGCTGLKTLNCDNNMFLVSLDVSGCNVLDTLTCNNTALTELDVRDCAKLTTVSCQNIQTEQLDFSKNTNLRTLSCWNENLSKIYITKKNGRTWIAVNLSSTVSSAKYVWKNSKGKVMAQTATYRPDQSPVTCEISGAKGYAQTVTVEIGSPQIGATAVSYDSKAVESLKAFLEITDSAGVTNGSKVCTNYDPDDPATYAVTWKMVNNIRCLSAVNWGDSVTQFNRGLIGKIDLSGCTTVTDVCCCYNNISEINLSGCSSLRTLDCRNIATLTDLDVSGCKVLETLSCDNTGLTGLDVKDCGSLVTLSCRNIFVEELDLSGNANIRELKCWNSILSNIILTKKNGRTWVAIDLTSDVKGTTYVWKNSSGKKVATISTYRPNNSFPCTCELTDSKSGDVYQKISVTV